MYGNYYLELQIEVIYKIFEQIVFLKILVLCSGWLQIGFFLFFKGLGIYVFKGIRKRYGVKGFRLQIWRIIVYFIEYGEVFLEKLVFKFLFLNARVGRERVDLFRVWRLCFYLRKVILNFFIFVKLDGSFESLVFLVLYICRVFGSLFYLFINYFYFLFGLVVIVYYFS